MIESTNRWALAAVYGALGIFVAWSLTSAKRSSKTAATIQSERSYAELIETWQTDPSFEVSFQALTPFAVQGANEVRAVFDENDDYWGLPRTEGFELVDLYCSACHSLQVVMQQRATYGRWKSTLEWMVDKQNMPPLPAEDEGVILTYLAEHFGQ